MSKRLTSKQVIVAINLYAKKTGVASTVIKFHSKLRAQACEYYLDTITKQGTKPEKMVCKK